MTSWSHHPTPGRSVFRRRKRSCSPRQRKPLALEVLESRRVPSLASAAIGLPVDPNIGLTGQLQGVGSTELYHVPVDADGLLTARVHPLGFGGRLSLLDGQGRVLIQSEASSPQDPDDRIALHVTPGDYYLMVQGSTGGGGAYQLAASFTAATAPSQPLTSISGSYSAAVADLNGDKVPDAIITDFYDNQVLVDLGLGDGSFRPPIAIPVGQNPVFVTTADLNGDGIPDIVTANLGSNDVSVLLGNGDGTFRPAVEIPAGPGASSVAVGDFNGDGHADLAVTDMTGDGLRILLGDGRGGLVQGATIPIAGNPISVAAADYDGDGRTDLAVAAFEGADLTILRGRGDGTFAPVQQLPTGTLPTSVLAADFDGGGRSDLAVACAGDDTVRVFQDRDGGFVPSAILHSATSPYGLAAADFDEDGRIDLAVTSYGAGAVSIFPGHGNGTFGAERRIPLGVSTTGIATADLNGDGRADLVTTDLVTGEVDVLLGDGDGAFQAPPEPSVPARNPAVVAADLNGDGIPDLIVPDYSAKGVSILLGRGDGTFRAPILVPTGLGPWGVAVGDFNGDGKMDLAVTDLIEDSVSILLGDGDGTFRLASKLQTAVQPSYIATADLDRDGRVDLVVSNVISESLSIDYGRGDGTFADPVILPVGSQPGNPVIADFDGDGRPDIAVAHDQGLVAVFLATGPRSFVRAADLPAGPGADLIATGDVNGDGHPDLVVADSGSPGPASVTILLGRGDGTFRAAPPAPSGPGPFAITLADLNGDGRPDLIATSLVNNDVALLLGDGDGTFRPPIDLPSDPVPFALAVADFDRDGRPDIAAVGFESGRVTLLLNRGGGAFSAPEPIAAGASQVAMVAADFNGDGRLDLAVADPANGAVRILLGDGDGTFAPGPTVAVGIEPSGVAVGDFNGDGRTDLAVADAGSDDVEVLLGLGDGTFSSPIVLPVGAAPHAIITGDFRHDGTTDIAVADEGSDDVAVLFGRGDGTFLPALRYAVGAEPVALVAADLGGDGTTELVTADRTAGDLTILWGPASGHPVAQTLPYGGRAPSALAAGDFNGDGLADLAVADEQDDRVIVLPGLGGGSFASPVSFDVGAPPDFLQAFRAAGPGQIAALVATSPDSQDAVLLALRSDGAPAPPFAIPLGAAPIGRVLGDFNGDGIPDMAMVTASGPQVAVRLGTRDGKALIPQDTAPLPQAAPIVVDWSDGTPHFFQLDQAGQLYMRSGRLDSPGEYEPQVLGGWLGVTFRDIAAVRTPYGPVVAALESQAPVIRLFSQAPGPGGGLQVRSITVPGAVQLVRIVSADLDRDGRDDLVLVDRGNEQVIVLYQAPDGTFAEDGPRLGTGQAPSDVAIADLDNDGWPDLIVSNTYSGDLSLFDGGPGHRFGPEVRLAGGLGAAELVEQDDGPARHTNDQPIGVAAADLGGSGRIDVVSVQSGADRISLLRGTPDGGLADPSLATSYSTGMDPTQVVAAPLTDDGRTDLVVLDQGSQDISVFLNDGKGGLITMPRVDAGNAPTGLAVRDVDGDGHPDLVVGNAQGDLLILLGNGDGTFRPYQRADQSVSLALGDFSGTGRTEYVLSNTSIDQLSIQYAETQSFVQGRDDGLKAPGAVAVADLNGDGYPDIIVLNRGENDMLVYPGLGGNRFAAPLRFFTGTYPEGLTVADLNGDGLPDIVVANAGSDDLSLFIASGNRDRWSLTPGPRLRVGRVPISTTVFFDGGTPDIVAVDYGSDEVRVLRGVGNGFFDDRHPLIFPTGRAPIRALVGRFDDAPGPGLAVVDSGSNDLTYDSDFLGGAPAPRSIPTGGILPVAAVMGDYNHDGYADIFIAHNADTRITLLEGGPDGPVLADSFSVGQSVQPTDLAVSTDPSGALQIYVAAQGKDQAIRVSVTLGAASPIVGPSGGYPPLPMAPPQGAPARAPLPSATGGLIGIEEPSPGIGAQVQASPSVATASMAPSGASGPATVVMAGLGAILPQIFTPSLAPLTLLVNNLVQIGQVQVSDLLPLDHSALDAVAVLIVVSGTPGAEPVDRGLGPIEEAEAGTVMTRPPSAPEDSTPPVSSSPGVSNPERFLLELEGAPSRPPEEVPEAARSRPERSGPPRGAGSAAADAAREGGPRTSTLAPWPGPSIATDRDQVPGDGLVTIPLIEGEGLEPGSTAEAEWGPSECGRLFGEVLIATSLLLAGRAVGRRWRVRGHHPARQPIHAIPERHPTRCPDATRSQRTREGRSPDLPPWLASSTSGCGSSSR